MRPILKNSHSAAILDYLYDVFFVFLDRGGLDHAADSLGYAALFAYHLAHILCGDAKLYYGSLVAFFFFNLDLVRLVH